MNDYSKLFENEKTLEHVNSGAEAKEFIQAFYSLCSINRHMISEDTHKVWLFTLCFILLNVAGILKEDLFYIILGTLFALILLFYVYRLLSSKEKEASITGYRDLRSVDGMTDEEIIEFANEKIDNYNAAIDDISKAESPPLARDEFLNDVAYRNIKTGVVRTDLLVFILGLIIIAVPYLQLFKPYYMEYNYIEEYVNNIYDHSTGREDGMLVLDLEDPPESSTDYRLLYEKYYLGDIDSDGQQELVLLYEKITDETVYVMEVLQYNKISKKLLSINEWHSDISFSFMNVSMYTNGVIEVTFPSLSEKPMLPVLDEPEDTDYYFVGGSSPDHVRLVYSDDRVYEERYENNKLKETEELSSLSAQLAVSLYTGADWAETEIGHF